jgi:hypothetical protein
MSDDENDRAKAAYESYDGFLKQAIRTYWEQGGDRANFIALLLASREAWEVAWEGVKEPGTGKKILTGAAGAAAVVVILRLLLGGPIGLVLTGASIVSLGALYAKNHKRIWAQQKHYKELVGAYRVKHQQVRGKFVDGAIDAEGRDLMFDGLLRRFLEELNVEPDLGEEAASEEEEEEDAEDADLAQEDSDDEED